jgi:two-component system phosphate regulon sensor histidine kinase PhoR
MPETKETFEELKKYIGELPIGLLLFDSNKKITSWNQYVLEILELKDEDFRKNDFGQINNQITEILESEYMTEKEIVGLSKSLKAKKIITIDKNIILQVMETAHESIGEMSHELRRPITNIKTLAESLLMGAINDPDIAPKFLKNINEEIDRLAKLVNEILNLSRIKAGKASQLKKKLNLRSRADDAIKLLQTLADKKNTKLINEVPVGYEIFGDQEQIDHVIQNLIENAIKYSSEESTVTVKAGPNPGSFQVDDTGIGMSESEIPKIFDRFYRVDRTKNKGSSGLGLSIVKNVVDLHGGKIEVKSKPGIGSSFIIQLPLE